MSNVPTYFLTYLSVYPLTKWFILGYFYYSLFMTFNLKGRLSSENKIPIVTSKGPGR